MDKVIVESPSRRKFLGAGSTQHLNLYASSKEDIGREASSPEIAASGVNSESTGDDITLAEHLGEH